MTTIPLIRSCALFQIVDGLNQLGTPTDRLLNAVNLSPAHVEDSEGLVSLYQSSELLEKAADLEGAEILSIHLGRQTPVSKLGTFGHIIRNSLTLFDLLSTVEQVVRLLNSGEQMTLRWDKDWVWVQHHCQSPKHAPNLQTQRYDLMLYLDVLRMVLGPDWQPSELYLEGPPCRALLSLDEFAGTYIHFMSPHNAIKVPRSALSLPLQPPIASCAAAAQTDYETFHVSAPAQEFMASLCQLLQALLPKGYPPVTLIAAAAGLSVRSLQRKLADQGLSYSRLVEKVRYERAVTLLQQPDIRLIDIAMELGYTDSSNFARAFERWTSISPSQFRLHHMQAK
jgi:AraC-like DNA-binding protein